MNKEKITLFLNIFTRISTGIFFFSGIYIAIFFGFEPELSVAYIFVILGLSAIFALGRLLVFQDETASKKIKLIQEICYFCFVNIIVLVVGFFSHWFSLSNVKTVIGMEVTILTVYITTMFITYRIEANTASKLNEKLKERKKS